MAVNSEQHPQWKWKDRRSEPSAWNFGATLSAVAE
jgi:hypothetical protein